MRVSPLAPLTVASSANKSAQRQGSTFNLERLSREQIKVELYKLAKAGKYT